MMKPINKEERNTLSQIVSESLKQYILDNSMANGQKLPPERELVTTLGVSRSVLREALRSLESAGILSIRHGEGAFVQMQDLSPLFEQMLFMWKMDNKKIVDLLELRRVFELAAIGQAVHSAKEEDFLRLADLAEQMEKSTGDTKRVQDTDIAFHRALIKATHSDLFMQISDLIVEYFSRVPHSHMNSVQVAKSAREHKQIVDALRSRNKEEAEKLLSTHLDYFLKYHPNVEDSV